MIFAWQQTRHNNQYNKVLKNSSTQIPFSFRICPI